jgi:hypothetical protein
MRAVGRFNLNEKIAVSLKLRKVSIPSALSLLENEDTNMRNELTGSGENNMTKNFTILVLFT